MDDGQYQISSETNNGCQTEWNNLNVSECQINESEQNVQEEIEESNTSYDDLGGMNNSNNLKSIFEEDNHSNPVTNQETTKHVYEQSDGVDESSEKHEDEKDYLLKALNLEAVKFEAVGVCRKRAESVHFTSPLAVIYEYNDDQNSVLDDTQSLSDSDLGEEHTTLQTFNNNQVDQRQENVEDKDVGKDATENKGNPDLVEQLDCNSKVETEETVRCSVYSMSETEDVLNGLVNHSESDVSEVLSDDTYDTLTPLTSQSATTKFTKSDSQPTEDHCNTHSAHLVDTEVFTCLQTETQLAVEDIPENEEPNNTTIEHQVLSEAILNYSALPDELKMVVDENEFYINNIPPEPQKIYNNIISNANETSTPENKHNSHSEMDRLDVGTVDELDTCTKSGDKESQSHIIREKDTACKRPYEIDSNDKLVDTPPSKQIKLDEDNYEYKEQIEVDGEDNSLTIRIKLDKDEHNSGDDSYNLNANLDGQNIVNDLETAIIEIDNDLEQDDINMPKDMENHGILVPAAVEGSGNNSRTDENNNLVQTDKSSDDLVNVMSNEEIIENMDHQQNVSISDHIDVSQTNEMKKTEETGTDNLTHIVISKSSEKPSQIELSQKEEKEINDIAEVEDKQVLVFECDLVPAHVPEHVANRDIEESAVELDNNSVMDTNEDNQNAETNEKDLKYDSPTNEIAEMVDDFEVSATESKNVESDDDVTGAESDNTVTKNLKLLKYEFVNEIDEDEDIVLYERQNNPEKQTSLNNENVKEIHVEEKVTSDVVSRDQLENKNIMMDVKEEMQRLLAHGRELMTAAIDQSDANLSKDMHSKIEVIHVLSDKVEIVEHFDEKENLEMASSQVVPENAIEDNKNNKAIATEIKNLQYTVDVDITDGSQEQSLMEETIDNLDDQHAVVPNNSPVFVSASQVLSESSQESGSTGFIYDESKPEPLYSSQESPLDLFVSCVRKGKEKKGTMYELAGDGVCHEVVEDKHIEVAEINDNTEVTMEVGRRNRTSEREHPEEQEEQLDDGKLDAYIDQAVEDAILDDHTVPCLPTGDPQSDDVASIYVQDNEKKGKLYSCDADIYDDTDTPLCSLVDRSGRSASLTGSCFRWKYTPSYDETSPADLPNEDQSIQINRLKTCGKPLRLGLSRKQPVNRLHNMKKRP